MGIFTLLFAQTFSLGEIETLNSIFKYMLNKNTYGAKKAEAAVIWLAI